MWTVRGGMTLVESWTLWTSLQSAGIGGAPSWAKAAEADIVRMVEQAKA